MNDKDLQTATAPTPDYLDGITLIRESSSSGHSFYWRPDTEDSVVFEDVVDRNEYTLPPQFKVDDIVIDIGAHIGSFTYAAALRRPGKIFAYEAHPVNHAIAVKNLEGFGDLVICRNLAVWRSDRPNEILYNEDITEYEGTGGISVLWNNEGLPVSTISLDDVLSEASCGFTKRIRFLKIDCEGAEYPILFTSKHLGIVDEICGEYHEIKSEDIPPRAKIDWQDRFDRFALEDFLTSRGWSVKIEPRGKSDGLFMARLKISDTPSPESEIDLGELKAKIQAAVERRQAEGRTTFIKAAAELYDLLSAQLSEPSRSSVAQNLVNGAATPGLTPLNLQPEFIARSDDHYHVDDLLKYHDSQFIWNAYSALLKREPDEPGLQAYLAKLRTGSFNKIDVLASLRFSPEGRRNNVAIDGLRARAVVRRAYRLPLLGYLIELVAGIIRLPALIRNQRVIETHLIAQQDRTAAHFNNTIQSLAERVNVANQETLARLSQLSDSFSQLTNEQKRFARLQHQQLSAIFVHQQKIASASTSNGHAVPSQNDLSSPASVAKTSELYANFQDHFRGEFDAVKEGFRIYLPLISEAGITDGILDLGCGRGEWLELLCEAGLRARGIDSNSVLAARARRRGLDVIESEAHTYLRGMPENVLNAVTAFHFVEHAGLDQLIELISEVHRVLKPGGLFAIETPNPKNLVVSACNFYSDPTHRQPLFPETLQFLIQQLGFEGTRLEYLHPVEGNPFTGSDEASRALSSWLFSARDYSIVAWKPINPTNARET